MDLKQKDKEQIIDGQPLPSAFQFSLSKRGKSSVNHQFDERTGELQVKCSTCYHWHPVYKLVEGAWKNVNQTYRMCNEGKENAYFDAYCIKCYENKNSKNRKMSIDKRKSIANGTEGLKSNGNEYLPWSEKNGGKQSSVFLLPELESYLKLYGVLHNKRKNQLINEIIADFKSKNPINF